jgi:hypothetical protein
MPEKPLVITVYKITGRQLFFNIRQSFCEECDLTVHAVKQALADIGRPDISVKVLPYLNYLPAALLRGVYHPPAVLIGKKVLSQGIVPGLPELRKAIQEALVG